MGTYTITKTKDRIDIFGYNQIFDENDKKDLWNKHKILYIGGIVAVWVEEREDINQLVHLMQEDDGHIFWSKEKDIRFDCHWLDNYIETMIKLKSMLN